MLYEVITGMHVLAKYVIDVVEDHFVIKHGGCRELVVGQRQRSYPRSRATTRSYEGMVKHAQVFLINKGMLNKPAVAVVSTCWLRGCYPLSLAEESGPAGREAGIFMD